MQIKSLECNETWKELEYISILKSTHLHSMQMTSDRYEADTVLQR